MSGPSAAVLEWLRAQLGEVTVADRHAHGTQDEVYAVRSANVTYYLKMSDALQAEHDNIIRLQPYLSVPEVIGFTTLKGRDCLLMSAVPGKNLVEWMGEWPVETLVKEFAAATRDYHDIPVRDLFADETRPNAVVTHGDMAMLNVLCTAPGNRGHIDLGKLTSSLPEDDIADAIWSLQRNLGPGYGPMFLEAYGKVEITEKIQKMLDFVYTPADTSDGQA
ncbi:hypothetical protein JNJ66_03815 [Candidatus Saccharibacteria bacterium]|nr:hypothetical protein [Candidatus Saccharibacteria bacterium]